MHTTLAYNRTRLLTWGAASALLCVTIAPSLLPAQTHADSIALMAALGEYVIQAGGPGQIAVRAGFDPRVMPGVRVAKSLKGISAADAAVLIGSLRARGGGRIDVVPVPDVRGTDSATAVAESRYGTVFAFGGLTIGSDTAVVTLTRTFHHPPRPSTFTSGDYVLTLVKRAPEQWQVISDSLLVTSDGLHSFAPLDNLPPFWRKVEAKRRGRPPELR